MYICQACQKQVAAGAPAHFIVTEKRTKVYPARFKIIKQKGHERQQKKVRIDNGGQGWEIVRQIKVCPDCGSR